MSAERPAAEAPPAARVGPYRTLDRIGEGGMSTVHAAVREDDAYEKRVAVKFFRADLRHPGLVQRFRVERQILASLDHPHIAKRLDGGSTAEGVPFLVMVGEAEAAFGRSLGMARRLLGPAHPRTLMIQANLGELLRQKGEPAAALKVLEEAAELYSPGRRGAAPPAPRGVSRRRRARGRLTLARRPGPDARSVSALERGGRGEG